MVTERMLRCASRDENVVEGSAVIHILGVSHMLGPSTGRRKTANALMAAAYLPEPPRPSVR